MLSSAQHHSTFCTFDELARPQIFSIAGILPLGCIMEPEIFGERNHLRPIPVYPGARCSDLYDGHRMKRLAILFLILALAAGAAQASQQGILVMKNWKTMDQCAKEAQTAFPDYTAASNEKRAAKEKECLAGKNLPPREAPAPGR
jgi:hypothetical protein